MEFDAEIDARNQFSKVTAYSWNQADQEISKIEANNPPVKTNGNLDSAQLAKVIGLKDLELKSGGKHERIGSSGLGEFQNGLPNKWQKCAEEFRFQGIDKVKPGTVLKLEGISDRLTETFYLRRAA